MHTRTIFVWKQTYWHYIILLLLIGVGAFVRLHNVAERDFWYDEAFTGIVIKLDWREMFASLSTDTHPPLYYILTKIIAGPFEYSVWSIRLLSVIAGTLTLGVVYALTATLSNKRAGLFAVGIAAISPFAIEYSQEARMYALLAFFQLCALYSFVRLLATNKRGWAIAWGLALALSLYTHYIALVTLPVYYLIFVVTNFLLLPPPRRARWRYCLPSVPLVIGYSVAALLFLPWSTHFIQQYTLSHTIIEWIPPAHFIDILKTIVIFFIGHPIGVAGVPNPNNVTYIPMVLIAYGLIALMGYAVYKARHNYRTIASAFVFVSSFVSGMFVLSLLGHYFFVSRYMIAAAFAMYIVVAIALSYAHKTVCTVMCALYIIMLLFIHPSTVQTGFNHLVAQPIVLRGKNVYVLNPYDYVVAKYYFGSDAVTLYNADNPTYNPKDWTGINGSLKQIQNIQTLLNDSRAIVLVPNTFTLNPLLRTQLAPISSVVNIQLYTTHRLSITAY